MTQIEEKPVDNDSQHRSVNDGLRIHRHTLVEMNRAVYTARRNAAHERLVEILQKEIQNQSWQKRFQYYRLCIRLIDSIYADTTRSQVLPDSPLIHYLKLMRRTLHAALSILHHDISLEQESAKFAAVLGRDVLERFKEHSTIFAENENRILICTVDLLQFGIILLEKDFAERRESFTKEDFRRYDKAYQEYRRHYWHHQPELV